MIRFSGREPGVPLVIGFTGAGAMLFVIAYGLAYGDFRAEGSMLLQMPWGIVTLIDVYVGLVLFSGWVAVRERNSLVAGTWIAAFLATGNLATCCYVLKAAVESRGRRGAFWTGRETDA